MVTIYVEKYLKLWGLRKKKKQLIAAISFCFVVTDHYGGYARPLEAAQYQRTSNSRLVSRHHEGDNETGERWPRLQQQQQEQPLLSNCSGGQQIYNNSSSSNGGGYSYSAVYQPHVKMPATMRAPAHHNGNDLIESSFSGSEAAARSSSSSQCHVGHVHGVNGVPVHEQSRRSHGTSCSCSSSDCSLMRPASRRSKRSPPTPSSALMDITQNWPPRPLLPSSRMNSMNMNENNVVNQINSSADNNGNPSSKGGIFSSLWRKKNGGGQASRLNANGRPQNFMTLRVPPPASQGRPLPYSSTTMHRMEAAGGGKSGCTSSNNPASSGSVMPNPDDILPKEAWTDFSGRDDWPRALSKTTTTAVTSNNSNLLYVNCPSSSSSASSSSKDEDSKNGNGNGGSKLQQQQQDVPAEGSLQQIENGANLVEDKEVVEQPLGKNKPRLRPRPPPRNFSNHNNIDGGTGNTNDGDISSDSEDERSPLYRGRRGQVVRNKNASESRAEDVEMLDWHESPLKIKHEDIC